MLCVLFQEFEVTLTKGVTGGLGFTVAGGVVFITCVLCVISGVWGYPHQGCNGRFGFHCCRRGSVHYLCFVCYFRSLRLPSPRV